MAKESFYFGHDYGARNDPKVQKILMRLGQAGKGVFWDLVEMLYEEGGYLNISEIESYAFAMRTDCAVLNSLINDFDLFKQNDKHFWSESILRRLDIRDEKSKKASKSAKTRWDKANAQKEDANVLQSQSEGNAIKEKKVKEIKGKESKLFVGDESPLINYQKFILLFNGFANRSFRITPKVKKALDARLKDYTKDEIKKAITIAHKDEYHISTDFKYLTPEFILREDKLEKFLNQSDSKKNGKAIIGSGNTSTGRQDFGSI